MVEASPPGMDPLATKREFKQIRAALRDAIELRDRFELDVVFECEPRELIDTILRQHPDILHFSGHGDQEGLYFHGDNGLPTLASSGSISDIFGAFRHPVRCVVLNACFSRDQAKLIAEHVAVVIGIEGEVPDAAAIDFAAGFYGALSQGHHAAEAFKIGKAYVSIGVSSNEPFSLFCQRGVDPARVYLHQASGDSPSAGSPPAPRASPRPEPERPTSNGSSATPSPAVGADQVENESPSKASEPSPKPAQTTSSAKASRTTMDVVVRSIKWGLLMVSVVAVVILLGFGWISALEH